MEGQILRNQVAEAGCRGALPRRRRVTWLRRQTRAAARRRACARNAAETRNGVPGAAVLPKPRRLRPRRSSSSSRRRTQRRTQRANARANAQRHANAQTRKRKGQRRTTTTRGYVPEGTGTRPGYQQLVHEAVYLGEIRDGLSRSAPGSLVHGSTGCERERRTVPSGAHELFFYFFIFLEGARTRHHRTVPGLLHLHHRLELFTAHGQGHGPVRGPYVVRAGRYVGANVVAMDMGDRAAHVGAARAPANVLAPVKAVRVQDQGHPVSRYALYPVGKPYVAHRFPLHVPVLDGSDVAALLDHADARGGVRGVTASPNNDTVASTVQPR